MLNQIVLVGRIADMSKDNEIIIRVPRNKKNEKGVYDDDFIPVTLEGTINENTREYCSEGCIVGIKGRMRMDGDQMHVIAERVSFLSTKPREDNEEDTD